MAIPPGNLQPMPTIATSDAASARSSAKSGLLRSFIDHLSRGGRSCTRLSVMVSSHRCRCRCALYLDARSATDALAKMMPGGAWGLWTSRYCHRQLSCRALRGAGSSAAAVHGRAILASESVRHRLSPPLTKTRLSARLDYWPAAAFAPSSSRWKHGAYTPASGPAQWQNAAEHPACAKTRTHPRGSTSGSSHHIVFAWPELAIY